MAERRMFAKTIIDSDSFLDMPLSAQALYMHLSMRADDDGFVNNPKRIQRMIGASEDDLRLLLAKSFILSFDTGVIVIKHWRINNWIRADRKVPTTYTDEYDMLSIKDNGAYSLETLENSGVQPNVNQVTTQYSIGKDSIDKNSKEESKRRFTPPSREEVQAYIVEKGYNVDAEAFIDFYTSKGWLVGKTPMKDWRAAVRTWAKRDNRPRAQVNNKFNEYEQNNYDFDALERLMVN